MTTVFTFTIVVDPALDFLSLVKTDRVQVGFNAPVVLSDALWDVTNYSLYETNDPTKTLGIKKINPYINGYKQSNYLDDSSPKFTNVLEILTDRHNIGTSYTLDIAVNTPLKVISGVTLSNLSSVYTGRRSKSDLVSNSVPKHFARIPGTYLDSLIMAIGMEDDRIGGGVGTPATDITIRND